MPVSNSQKAYLDDPYTTEFTATVVAAEARPGGGFTVLLDRSYFYPESGGQTADLGFIGDLPVVDVREGDNDTVLHVVASETPPSGEVKCTVDRGRRFDHMQQHTGQHVLSRAFIEVGDLHTVSFHMGEETCTIDLEGRFGDESAGEAEARANAVICENRPVHVRTVPVDELDAGGLRRKVPDGVTDARLVEVDGFDTIPCCGTHVSATGELGVIKVLKWEKVKGGNHHRVYFVVGRRALADYGLKHDIVAGLAGRFTTAVAEVDAKVEKLMAENQALKKQVKAMAQRLAAVEADELLGDAAEAGGVRVVARVLEGDGAYARAVSAVLKESSGVLAVLGASDGTVVCSVSDDVAFDIAALAVPRAKELGGSGGGRGGFAQIKLPDSADSNAFIEGIVNHVRSSLQAR